MKQAVKKKSKITPQEALSAFKMKNGIITKENPNVAASNADKPMKWLIMPKGYQDATKLPGIPLGYFTSILGHTNVGKTTLVNHAITQAQKMGLLPVIIDTENAFSVEFAQSMGFEAEPIYGMVEMEEMDIETGEIFITEREEIVGYDGNLMYFNSRLLADRYGDIDWSKGVRTKTKRKIAVIEDVAALINDVLDAQDRGEIQQGILFVWDSVGSIGCYKELSSGGDIGKNGNPMWTAAAISAAFNMITNDRIPSSRKISSEYTNTLLTINKIWLEPNMAGLPPTVRKKGGNALGYSCRLELFLGGKMTSGTKQLTATSKGATFNYGIETKIQVTKNHLPEPWNLTYQGKYYATSQGIVALDELDSYKKEHIGEILKQLNRILESQGEIVTEADAIEFSEMEDDVA